MNKLILLAGASGSGKSTIAKLIAEKFQNYQVQIICIDQFYDVSKPITNYDHPRAFDWELLLSCVNDLINGKTTKTPHYDYEARTRTGWTEVQPSELIILEGILTLHNVELNKLANFKVFVDTPADECLIRRLLRDTGERKRDFNSIINQWRTTVRPMYKQFCLPQIDNADIIIPWSRQNYTGLKIIFNEISNSLSKKEN